MTEYYAGLDVSMKKTYVVVTDATGKIVRQKEVATEINDLVAYLGDSKNMRVCLESGSISHWLARGLMNAGFDVIVAEARHLERYLSARTNKNDKNDAIGIAEALRAGLVKPVAVKSETAQAQQVLLGSRRQLQQTGRTLANSIRGHLKSAGIRFYKSLSHRNLIIETRAVLPEIDAIAQHAIEGLCQALAEIDRQIASLDDRLRKTVHSDTRATLLQSIPGVGPITALTYLSAIDDASRFDDSRIVGAYVGLTPRQYASGEVNRIGHISKRGHAECRSMLYEAALCMLTRCKQPSNLKSWGLGLVKRKGIKRAAVAVARKLATIMHRMLLTGELFVPTHKAVA